MAFDAKHFENLRATKEIGKNLLYFPVASSTMEEADKLIEKGAAAGTVVVADCQTNGIGRNNRSWSSSSNENLYVSFVLRPPGFQEVVNINFSAPLAVAMVAKKYGVKDPRVKWPNDVWINAKKVAGVLLNTTTDGKGKLAVNLGIGVNINQDMTKVQGIRENEATSIFLENGKEAVEREAFMADLCEQMEHLTSLNRDSLMEIYKEFDLLLGSEIVVMPNKREDPSTFYKAVAIEYSKEGYLVVDPVGGRRKTLSSEEVSIRP